MNGSIDQQARRAACTVFETAIGTCGIVWSDRGLLGVQLPERDAVTTREQLRRRFPDALETAPQGDIGAVITRIVALLRGERVDLTDVVLNMDAVPELDRDVYTAARQVPPGMTATYGEIAKRIRRPDAARDVGVALARNPFAIVVPCHRIVAANGKTGGFSAGGGVKTKLKLLAIEGGGGAGPLFESVDW